MFVLGDGESEKFYFGKMEHNLHETCFVLNTITLHQNRYNTQIVVQILPRHIRN